MLHLFGGNTATTRAPRQWHFPWKELGIGILALVVVAAIVVPTIHLATDLISGSARVEPRQIEQMETTLEVNLLAQTEPEAVAPVIPLITVEWQEPTEPWDIIYYAWHEYDDGVLRNSLEDSEGARWVRFVGTGVTKDTIVYIRAGIGGNSEVEPFEFSPDGKHWLQVKNLPDVPGLPRVQGAIWDGEDILILANWQYKAWQYKMYVARITPENLKGLLK